MRDAPPATAVLDPKPFFDREDLARIFGVTTRTVDRWHAAGILPSVHLGKPRWPRSVVEAVMAGELIGVGTLEKLERKSEKMKTRIEEILRRVGEGRALTPRQRNELRSAPSGTVDGNIADMLGYRGDDIQGAIGLAIKIDADRERLVSQIAEITAGGEHPNKEERAAFLSRVAMLRGQPSQELCLALDISTTASWNVVRDALARRFDAKPARRAA